MKALLSCMAAAAMLVHSSPSVAQPVSAKPIRMTDINVDALCSSVSDKITGGKVSERKFAWDRLVREWSGISHHNELSENETRLIREFWKLNRDQLRCTQLGFSVTNGSIWKLGVERHSNDFIETALMDWKIIPNDVDCSGETPLDYINRQIIEKPIRFPNANLERFDKIFRDLFIEYGAKRASELSVGERVKVGCK